MTIGTGDIINKFGTQDDLDNTTGAVTDTSFSDGTNDLNAWTDDDDAPIAVAVLEGAFASAPSEGAPIHLHMRKIDIEAANDEPVPSANYSGAYVGSFIVQASTGSQRLVLEFPLPSVETSQVYHAYIENQAGQTLSAGWTLHITPKTVGPHA